MNVESFKQCVFCCFPLNEGPQAIAGETSNNTVTLTLPKRPIVQTELCTNPRLHFPFGEEQPNCGTTLFPWL